MLALEKPGVFLISLKKIQPTVPLGHFSFNHSSYLLRSLLTGASTSVDSSYKSSPATYTVSPNLMRKFPSARYARYDHRSPFLNSMVVLRPSDSRETSTVKLALSSYVLILVKEINSNRSATIRFLFH